MAVPNCDCSEYSADDVAVSGIDPTPSGCECLVSLVRGLSGDTDTVPDFSDSRVVQAIRAAAFYVTMDLVGCSSIEKPTVDPCGNFCESPLDYPAFSMLVALRAACLMDIGQVRAKAASEGIRAVLGPASMQVAQASSSFVALFKWGSCSSYNAMREDLCFRNPLITAECARQVVSTFAHWNWGCGGGNCCASC